jgi:hypothetical protein
MASTAVGFESGPAIANGAPLRSANTIAMTPALIRPYPTAKCSVPDKLPEKMKATYPSVDDIMVTAVMTPDVTSFALMRIDKIKHIPRRRSRPQSLIVAMNCRIAGIRV